MEGARTRRFNRALYILFQVAPFALVFLIGLSGSFPIEFVALETAIVFGGVWLLYRSRQSPESVANKPMFGRPLVSLLELVLLAAIGFSLLFDSGYARPPAFFFLVSCYYALLFFETVNFRVSSTTLFILKLGLGQFLFIESFASLYPGFVAVDSYRDFFISQYILSHRGGLPHLFFSGAVWYDITPMAPILYSTGNLISAISLQRIELLMGFMFSFVAIAAVGTITRKLTSNALTSRLAMLLGSLMPYFWVFSTWPIPETFALTLVCLCMALGLQGNRNGAIIASSPLVLAIVFTHGGMAIILAGIMTVMYVFARSRSTMYMSLASIVLFLAYSTYAYLSGVESAVVTLESFILSALTPVSLARASTLVQPGGIISIIEAFVATFWWVLLAAFAWVNLLVILNQERRLERASKVMILIATVISAIGIFSEVLPTQVNAIRYLGLIGFPLLCIPASMGLIYLVSSKKRKLIVHFVLLLLVVSGVASPLVSPDLWQNLGQGNYAASNRIQASTTSSELTSQTYLDNHDNRYYIMVNYLPWFINITRPLTNLTPRPSHGSSLFFEGFSSNGLIGEPHIVLTSLRAASLEFPSPGDPVNITSRNDVVYSSQSSVAAFIWS